MALVHDLAESIVGDITPLCGVSKEEKIQRELVRAWVYTCETSMQPSSFPQLSPNMYPIEQALQLAAHLWSDIT